MCEGEGAILEGERQFGGQPHLELEIGLDRLVGLVALECVSERYLKTGDFLRGARGRGLHEDGWRLQV